MKHLASALTLVITTSFAFIGCAVQTTKTPSDWTLPYPPYAPRWVYAPGDYMTDSTIAFTGVSARHAGLPQARDDAMLDALGQIAEYKSKVLYEVRDDKTRLGVHFEDVISGADVSEYYTVHGDDQGQEWYQVYALVFYPK